MSIDSLLPHLHKVRRTGRDKWIALCPAHDDRSPSLAIKEHDDGVVLVHCFGGCAVEEVLSAVGLTFDALYPGIAAGEHTRPERRPFPAADVLRCLANEVLIAMCAASAMSQGKALTSRDQERLVVAASRFQAALRASGYA